MKKNVRVLLTVLVIIIVAVGGYFVYRGQDTSTTETVENEPSEETKSTTNTHKWENIGRLLFRTKSYKRCF